MVTRATNILVWWLVDKKLHKKVGLLKNIITIIGD